MTEQDEHVDVPLLALIELAIDSWRLNRCLGEGEAGATGARHAARRLSEFLKKHGIEIQDLTGQVYEPGLALEVIENNTKHTDGPMAIEETISPGVLLRGKLVRQGRVIIRGA